MDAVYRIRHAISKKAVWSSPCAIRALACPSTLVPALHSHHKLRCQRQLKLTHLCEFLQLKIDSLSSSLPAALGCTTPARAVSKVDGARRRHPQIGVAGKRDAQAELVDDRRLLSHLRFAQDFWRPHLTAETSILQIGPPALSGKLTPIFPPQIASHDMSLFIKEYFSMEHYMLDFFACCW